MAAETTRMTARIPRISVRVGAPPDPFLLRSVIAAKLAGRAVPAGPEAQIAAAVADRLREEGRCR